MLLVRDPQQTMQVVKQYFEHRPVPPESENESTEVRWKQGHGHGLSGSRHIPHAYVDHDRSTGCCETRFFAGDLVDNAQKRTRCSTGNGRAYFFDLIFVYSFAKAKRL